MIQDSGLLYHVSHILCCLSCILHPASCYCSGFNCGNNITSLIDCELVSNITSLSIPIPSPAAGGIPYSRALTKSSSIQCAASSPCALASTCVSNLCLCSIGSISSENALAISLDVMNNSNLSASAGLRSEEHTSELQS